MGAWRASQVCNNNHVSKQFDSKVIIDTDNLLDAGSVGSWRLAPPVENPALALDAPPAFDIWHVFLGEGAGSLTIRHRWREMRISRRNSWT